MARKLSDSPRYPFDVIVSYIRLAEINFTFICASEMSNFIKIKIILCTNYV